MEFFLFILWIGGSAIVSAIGEGRTIGAGPAFFISFLLSPLIGFIVVIVSKTKEQDKLEKKTLEMQHQHFQALSQAKPQVSNADEMRKLKSLLDEGVISWEEFNKLKDKLIN